MATYYVNPTGSNTAPFDTVAKGANNFKILTDSATLLDTDTTYIEGDNGDIVDTTFYNPPLEIRGTITKNPTSANRPVVSLYIFIQTTYSLNYWNYNYLEISHINFEVLSGFVSVEALYDNIGDFILDSCIVTGSGSAVRIGAGYADPITIDLVRIKNCIFHDMNAGISVYTHDVAQTPDVLDVVNNTFYNIATDGFYGRVKGTSYIFKNNILHTCGVGRQIGYSSPPAGVDVDYNIAYNCTTPFSVLPQQANELTDDPLLTDPANDDFTLDDLSPAINAGTPTSATYDIRGVARPVGGVYDIGAYEGGTPTPTFDGITFLGMIKGGYLKVEWSAATGDPDYYDIYLKASDDTDLFTDTYFNHSVNSDATNTYVYQDASQALLADDTVYYVGVRSRNIGGSDTNTVAISNPIVNRINPKLYPSQNFGFN